MPLSPPPVHPDSKNAAKQRMSTSSESVAGLAHSESDVTTASSSTVGPEEFGQQLEDIDLATFLARQSRDFSEATVKEAARVRQLRWQTVDVQPWEHSGYLDTFEACLARISEYVPPDMLTDYYVSESEDGGDTKLSMSRLRGAGERLYMLVPPSKIFSIRSHVRDLAYWRDRQKTLFAALAYLIALYQDLVPAFLLSVSILLIVKRRLFPPSSTQLRADVLERRQLAKEAKDIGADFQLRGQLHHFGSFMATPSSTSKTGAAASVVDDDAPRELDEAATPPPPLSPTSSISSTTALPSPSRRNTLSLAREVGSRFGPDIQLLLEEIANTGEKLRNLVLFRDSAASWRVLSIWSAFALLLFVIPASVIPRALFAWLGLHVFAFAYLRHRFPRYRRVRVSLFLLSNPSDFHCAPSSSTRSIGCSSVCPLTPRQLAAFCTEEPHPARLSLRSEISNEQIDKPSKKSPSRCPLGTRISVDETTCAS